MIGALETYQLWVCERGTNYWRPLPLLFTSRDEAFSWRMEHKKRFGWGARFECRKV